MLELSDTAPKRLAHLGQTLGTEHEQKDDEQDRYVRWIV
jgi:hypothetical protein